MSSDLAKRTFLDRTIGLISPAAELRRIRARVALGQIERMFEGATKGRRTQNWMANNSSINALIAGGLPTLRARSRYLGRNQPYAGKAISTIVGNTIGEGILPQARSKTQPQLAAVLEDLWINWGDEVDCDADGRLDFYGLQALAMKTVVESGSCLIRRRRRRTSDGLAVPIQIQLLEPDFLDVSKDQSLANGGRILQGVEYDKGGRRVAYHLYSEHPGDRILVYTGLLSNRVPADEIIHVYRMDRVGQVDGVPWGAPCIIRIKDLDEYEDAQLIRQKIAACFVAFVHDIEALDSDVTSGSDKAAALEKVEPGILEVLPPGKTVTFGTPPPAEGYGPHTTSVLRSIAAGFGCTYEAMTGDYSQVNFSSGRLGHLEYYRNIRQWQNHMMISLMCKGVWRWFSEAAVLTGKADSFVPATWTPPRREMIDPVKETEAIKTQVRCGFISQSEAIRQTGKDPADVFSEITTDNEIIDENGFVFDTDPRQDATSAGTPNLVEAP